MRSIVRILHAALLGAAMSVVSLAAQADGYPSKPVRIIVSYAAGGATDSVARQLAAAITEKTGQQVLVDNRPGAASQIGIQSLLSAPADGYTVILADPSPLTINPYLFKKLSYQPAALTPITRITKHYVGMVVSADSPYKSVRDFVEAAKAAPGKLTFGHPGTGTNIHLSGMRFNSVANIDVTAVPYRGDLPALQELAGGNTAAAWVSVNSAMPLVQGGKVRVLAVMSDSRVRALPDVPTFVEAGYPAMTTTSWLAIFAPPNMPAATVNEINGVFRWAAHSPKVVEWMAGNAMDPLVGTPQELANLVKSDSATFSAVIKQIGLTLD